MATIWTEHSGTDLDQINPCPGGGCVYTGNTGFKSVMLAWSGGCVDTLRNRLLIWGGGHADYYGNEVYAYDLDTNTWAALTTPSLYTPTVAQGNADLLPDGRPVARHTYNSMVYIESKDWLMCMGGSAVSPHATGSTKTWYLDLAENPLTWREATPCPNGIDLGFTAYNNVTDKVYYNCSGAGGYNLYEYDPQTDVHTYILNNSIASRASGAIDTTRNNLLYVGRLGYAGWIDLDTSTKYDLNNNATWTGSLGDTISSSIGPGLVYDPTRDEFVWYSDTGKSFYRINPSSWEVTLDSSATGATPAAETAYGTHGRFNYVPSLDRYVYVNSVFENVFTLERDPVSPPTPTTVVPDLIGLDQTAATAALTAATLATGTVTQTTDAPTTGSNWLERSKASGVIRAINFDTEDEVLNWVHQDADADHVVWETTEKCSGAGSCRINILNTDNDGSGQWRTWLADDERDFREGDVFYVSYRAYIPEYLAHHEFLNGGGWKLSIISRRAGDMNGVNYVGTGTGSNQLNEIVINNFNYKCLVQGYNRDSGGEYVGWYDNFPTACSATDIVYQNQVDRGVQAIGTPCENDRARYGGLFSFGLNGGYPDPLTGAFIFKDDEWHTFKFKVTLGSQGTSTYDSRVQLWAQHGNTGGWDYLVDKWVDLGFDDQAIYPPHWHDAVWLLPFDTNKDPDPTREDTYILYDELLVSTEDIAPPEDVDPVALIGKVATQSPAAGTTVDENTGVDFDLFKAADPVSGLLPGRKRGLARPRTALNCGRQGQR